MSEWREAVEQRHLPELEDCLKKNIIGSVFAEAAFAAVHAWLNANAPDSTDELYKRAQRAAVEYSKQRQIQPR
jgi:hypothetical protein